MKNLLLALLVFTSCCGPESHAVRKYARGTIVYIAKEGYAVEGYLNDSLVTVKRLDCKTDFCNTNVRESQLSDKP